MATQSLVGCTYTDTLHRTITILGEDELKGPGYVLVERDDGARWGVEIALFECLPIPLRPPAKESDDA